MKEFFKDSIPQNGLTYDEFVSQTKFKLDNTNNDNLNDEEKYIFNYTKLNYHRMLRIDKTYKVSEEIVELVSQIKNYQLWMVLTEDWCGDSAQNLPYINKIASLNSNIHLRILERDKHLEIMDQYLTNGKSRSIPKLVAFDINGNELFIWGPRPNEAQEYLNSLNNLNLPKDEIIEKLHLWYSQNKGKALEKEFIELLKTIN